MIRPIQVVKRLLNALPVRVAHPIVPSVGFLGISVFPRRKANGNIRAQRGLEKCLALEAKSMIDVGSGRGEHICRFLKKGWRVTSVDLQKSDLVVAEEFRSSYTHISADINNVDLESQFDLVWSSHCLEHQLNANSFIRNLFELCKADGVLAITVPFPHRRLLGGHVSMWTPGLLLYHCVLAGINCVDAEVLLGDFEFTVLICKIEAKLPKLNYDKGDIQKLKEFLPVNYFEGGDQWGNWSQKAKR